MPTNKEQVKASRAALREKLGDKEYKRMEREKRAARRAKVKKKTNPEVAPGPAHLKELKQLVSILQSEISKPSLPIQAVQAVVKAKGNVTKARAEENCDNLLQAVIKAKKQVASDGGYTLKIKSVTQQFKRVTNLHKWITGNEDCSNFEFLRDLKGTLAFIKDRFQEGPSQNTQLIAISSILSVMAGYESEYRYYSKLSTKNAVEHVKEMDKNEAKADFISWADIQQVLRTKKKVPARARAIASVYTLMPPRRVEDVGTLKLSDSVENTKSNYVIITDGVPVEFVYQTYKTGKTFHAVTIPIPGPLRKVLKAYIKSAKLALGNYLFPTNYGKRSAYKNFSPEVTRAFGKYSDLHITVNDLRHAYISDFYETPGRTGTEKKELGIKMGHSVQTQSHYAKFKKG